MSIEFVRQVSDEMKAQVPEEVLKAARQMNRKAYEERLRQIKYVFTKAFYILRIPGSFDKYSHYLNTIFFTNFGESI